jgi:hypothetical protein
VSAQIKQRIVLLQREAVRRGIGKEFRRAFQEAVRRLQTDPHYFGEPMYRLSALRLQVRHASIRPLVIYFAVHEELPHVFLKDVGFLPE